MFNLFVTRCRTLLSGPATLPGGLDWKMRRAPPLNADRALQSETHDWLRQIPRWLHPTQLCRHYPRLANRVARRWSDAPQVARLLSDLMIDRRGNRRGFAPRIRQEIERLYRYNAERMNPPPGGPQPVVAPRTTLSPPPTEPKRRVEMGPNVAQRPVGE
jgi:hypothetical protein